MQNNLTPYDIKKSIKRGFIYLLIALPFMLVVATILTIVKAPQWLTMLSTVVIGGCIVLICAIIYSKLEEKRKKKNEGKYDSFRD